jgi:SOS-response transcriptional repressor LexA
MATKKEISAAVSRVRGRVLAYIKDYTAQNGYPPTLREIRAATGAKAVWYHLLALKKEGRIDYLYYRARTIRVLE